MSNLIQNDEALFLSRLKKVERVLISQPQPTDPASPFLEVAKKYNLKMDFRPFIKIEPLDVRDFRKQKINILEHTAIVLTSRNAVDNLFRICAEIKLEMPAEMKYFCISEQTANYLQKYIVIRKRKIFTGTKTASELVELIKKHKNEKFLFPCSNMRRDDIPEFASLHAVQLTEAVLYKTVSNDFSDIPELQYDLLAFFSPSGIKSLFENYPSFQQKNTRVAVFGPTTAKAAREAGLIIDIEAPMPNAPSMAGALDLYIKRANTVS